jgi:hypothetical protein
MCQVWWHQMHLAHEALEMVLWQLLKGVPLEGHSV